MKQYFFYIALSLLLFSCSEPELETIRDFNDLAVRRLEKPVELIDDLYDVLNATKAGDLQSEVEPILLSLKEELKIAQDSIESFEVFPEAKGFKTEALELIAVMSTMAEEEIPVLAKFSYPFESDSVADLRNLIASNMEKNYDKAMVDFIKLQEETCEKYGVKLVEE